MAEFGDLRNKAGSIDGVGAGHVWLEACRILEQNGFRQVRRRGRHIIMQRQEENTISTVPVPDHRALRIGTLLAGIRQSGLDRELFEE